MPYTPAPRAPSRTRPAEFSDEGDAFVAWLGPFNDFVEEVRVICEESADTSVESAAASEAAASVSLSAANYKGDWSLLSGALAMPACVSHAGAYWMLTSNIADVTAAQPGVSPVWRRLKNLLDARALAYADRGTLRSITPMSGDVVAVRGLGIFAWVGESSKPDDDETVFARAGGAWELVGAGPDYVYAVQEALQDDIESLQETVAQGGVSISAAQTAASAALLDAAAAQSDASAALLDAAAAQSDASDALLGIATLNDRILRGTFTMSLTTLAAISSSSFSCTVTGAAVGDSVIVNPGKSFGTSGADQARLSCVAYVSAANTVTVTVRNASAASAAMSASTWTAIVIKQ